MTNIYDVLPLNFFNLFDTKNKEAISDCLFVLYEYIKDDNSFVCLKENFLFELEKYFSTHMVDFEEVETKTPKEHASYIYRRLKMCGWIHEDRGDNFQFYVCFEDYALTVIETLFNLENDKEIEYTSIIYNIYAALKNFDVTNGDKILDTQYNLTRELITKLKILNSNIKLYIRRLLKESNDTNNLNELLNSFLSEYQMKIIDRAFYNLTTKDQPTKYRNTIISKLDEICDSEESVDVIVNNISESKDVSYEEAYRIFNEQVYYIRKSFEGIDGLISEISHKNEQYVAAATNRIMFVLSETEDISGKINKILKASKNCEDALENIIYVSENEVIDEASIKLPRAEKIKQEQVAFEEILLDPVVKEKALSRIKLNVKYTQTSIQKQILERLKTKN